MAEASVTIMHICTLVLFTQGCLINYVDAQWSFSPEQTDVYDLVDEVKDDLKGSFYDYIGVSQDATTSEIRRSYRKLSLAMHPDKNKTEGAEEKFRILVAIYEILKNKEKREIYNNVLSNGLPAAYLYVPSRMRKMNMFEFSVIITLILTLGHFLFLWASYFEKKLTLEERLPQMRKKQRKLRKNYSEIESTMEQLSTQLVPKPTYMDILPIVIAKSSYNMALWVPKYYQLRQEEIEEKKKQEEELKREEEEEEKRLEELKARREEAKRIKQEKIRQFKEEENNLYSSLDDAVPRAPSAFEESSQSIEDLEAMYDDQEEIQRANRKKKGGQPWTDDDERQLVALMAKYPGGMADRWDVIGREMGRTVADVTSKAKQARMRIGQSKNSSKTKAATGDESDEDVASTPNVRQRRAKTGGNQQHQRMTCPTEKSKDAPLDVALRQPVEKSNGRERAPALVASSQDDKWDQSQQKLLEMALGQFSKTLPERWEKIAKCVPGKTKEECIARYRYLSEKIQQKKKKS